jgi:hypothetical protein
MGIVAFIFYTVPNSTSLCIYAIISLKKNKGSFKQGETSPTLRSH